MNSSEQDEDFATFAGQSQILVQGTNDDTHSQVRFTTGAGQKGNSIGGSPELPSQHQTAHNSTAPLLRARGSRYVQLNFVLQGIVNFAVWNSILNSLDYYENRYTPSYHVAYVLPVPYFVGVASTAIFMMKIQELLNFQKRIAISLVANTCFLVALPLVTNFLTPDQKKTAFAITMVILFASGACTQVFFASMVGCASKSGSIFIVAFNLGTACSLIILALLRTGSLLIYNGHHKGQDAAQLAQILKDSTSLFFFVAAFLNTGALLSHFLFIKSRLFHLQQEMEFYSKNSINSFAFDEISIYSIDAVPIREREEGEDQNMLTNNAESNTSYSILQYFLSIYKMVHPLPLFMALTSAQTLMMFPGVTLGSTQSEKLAFTWNVVLFISTFGLFNAIAKFITRYRYLYSRNCLYYLVFLRFPVFVYFIIALILPNQEYLHNLVVQTVAVIIFSFTDGFCVAGFFLYAADEGIQRSEKEHAGFVMVLFYAFGQMLGTFLALPFTSLT